MAENSIQGTIPCSLIGGPLDAAKYGDLPDLGGPFTGAQLSVPAGPPADEHPHAIYRGEGQMSVDGHWQCIYLRTEGPAMERTCEGFVGSAASTLGLDSLV